MSTITQKDLVTAMSREAADKVRYAQTLPPTAVTGSIRFLNPLDKRRHRLTVTAREFFEEMTETEFQNIKFRIENKKRLQQKQLPVFAPGVVLHNLFS